MGSITNSLASNPVSNTGTSSSANPTGIFTGTSAYSTDFQNLINRAVAIASMPINLLTGQQTALTNQSKELATLDTLFTKLQTSVQGIGSALGGSSFQADYSVPGVVSATLADGATQGVYSIKVDQVGAYAASLSAKTWDATPATGGGGSPYTLVVGAGVYTVTPADNSAQTLASTINSQYGNLVHATAVNVGSSGSPDQRISLQSTTLGPMNLDLIQIPTGAVTTSLQGASASASYSTSLTSAPWVSSGQPFSLVVDGVSHSITTPDNSARGVVAALNAQYGDLVQATVVNQGTAAQPDYRISLQSSIPGSSNLDLSNASHVSLQQQMVPTSYATSQTGATWNATADASGSRSIYTLIAGSNRYSFTPADNTAASVASAINSQFGATAQATVVNLGTPESPDYRISLHGASQGTAMTMDIQKTSATSYQKVQTNGNLSAYEVDGGMVAYSNTRAVQVSNGVTLNLQSLGTTDVTVTRSTSVLNTALSSFADAYNATVDELTKQKGQSAGPLEGQAIVTVLSNILSKISTYSAPTGQYSVLENLGLKLGTDGHITYNVFTLMGADLGNSAGVTAFLGSAAGGGFLQAATNALNSLEDPATGLLKSAQTDMKTQLTNIGNQISTKQNQVDQLQRQLISQMAAADALIASMEQQYSYISSMFQAQQTASQMYK